MWCVYRCGPVTTSTHVCVFVKIADVHWPVGLGPWPACILLTPSIQAYDQCNSVLPLFQAWPTDSRWRPLLPTPTPSPSYQSHESRYSLILPRRTVDVSQDQLRSRSALLAEGAGYHLLCFQQGDLHEPGIVQSGWCQGFFTSSSSSQH